MLNETIISAELSSLSVERAGVGVALFSSDSRLGTVKWGCGSFVVEISVSQLNVVAHRNSAKPFREPGRLQQ